MNKKHLIIALSVLCVSGNAFAAKQASETDKTFVENAAQGNLAEVKIGKLGLKNSSNPQVLKISKHLIHDHETANQSLKKVSQKLDVPMPKQVNAEQKATCEKLSSLKGKAFDEEFLKVGLEDHKKDAEAYQQEIDRSKNTHVKDYAATYLPKIKEHKAMFQQAEGKE